MFNLLTRRTQAERWVRACITNISVPQNTAGLQAMLKKQMENTGHAITHLESLLKYRSETMGYWTAPRYMQAGDILFFYHAASAKARIAALQRRVGDSDSELLQVLERNAKLADTYAGKIFACAEVTGPAEYVSPGDADTHYKSRHMVPYNEGKVVIFKHPLGDFAEAVSIKRGVALTPVEGQSFEVLKQLLAQHNRLPPFLASARPGGVDFAGVSTDTWRAISCAEDKRFSDESQVRGYLINYLLDEIKDPGIARLEECPCYRKGRRTGVADYMVCIGGRWLPVEAKLNIHAERDMLAQAQQYIHIDTFQGPNRQRHVTPRQPYCLIIDQSGVYLCADDAFVIGGGQRSAQLPETPLLTRADLSRLSGAEVSARLLTLLAGQ